MASRSPNFPTSVSPDNDDHTLSMDKVDCERAALLGQDARLHARWSSRVYFILSRLVGFLGFALLVQLVWSASPLYHGWQREAGLSLEGLCPQVDALSLPEHDSLLESLDEEFDSAAFRLKAYESLGGAVRIPTESYDDLGLPLEDPRWEIEAKFHDYLESRFPRVHASLKLTKVDTYALLYEWKGTTNAKPLLLAAHTDVVPVNPDTYDDWTHPPYSGYYDGEWIWGRGSSDDKPGVIGSLIAIETLLERGFVPSRTVLLAFGVDEEVGGRHGAHAIAQYLLRTHGPDSLAMMIDEGTGFSDMNGITFASPAVTEKGMMNIRMDVLTHGGHSSIPPKHTGIGILANLITELEARPHHPRLVRGRTYYQRLECRAKYDPGFLPLRTLLLESQTSDKKLRELGGRLIDYDADYSVMSRTTQAIDLIGGGVKANALPEVAWAVGNYRTADHNSLAELMAHFTDITLSVAAKHNMTLEAFGKMVGLQDASRGTIRLYDFKGNGIGPAPVTPTVKSGPYELLSGTIRSTIQTHLRTDGLSRSVIVSPGITHANTDTRHYWNLTKHIFRYNHRGNRDSRKAHTVNEALRAEAFLEQIRFFARLILNADKSDLLE